MKFEHQVPDYQDFDAYMEMMRQLVSGGKTTGENQSESFVNYTKLNFSRLKRLNKTSKLNPLVLEKLKNIQKPQFWLVLTESWCGDAAQNLPIISKMAEASPQIELGLILRDDHIDIMDDFKTNGGRSIPKLIALDEDKNVLFTWGPRPNEAQQMYLDYRNGVSGQTNEEFKFALHQWYAKDKGATTQQEFAAVL